MSIEFALEEENCFNLYWKIKNFSYGSEAISSPEFLLDGEQHKLYIQPKLVECRLIVLRSDYKYQFTKYVLSLVPCDGSSPLISYNMCLQVSKEILFKKRRSAFLPEDTLTVRFQHPVLSKRGNLLVRSQIGIKRKFFLWTLKGLNEGKYNTKDFTISAENSDRYGILELCLKTMDGINSDENFYIEISRTNGEKCYCVLKVSVLYNDGKTVNCVSDEFLFKNQSEKVDSQKKWIFPPIIKNSKLFACKDRLFPNDTLSLKCEIVISLGTITDQTAVLSYFEEATPLLQESEELSKYFKEKSTSDSVTDLQMDLKKILDSSIGLFDVSLQVSSEAIPAHKAILGARLSVFESLLTNSKENYVNSIVIDDLEVDTVRKLLLYMYTDTIDDYQESSIRKLYLAAVKYQILSLKQKCSAFLRTNVSISNACELLVLGDIHKDGDLEKAVLNFISIHHFEVFASKKWKSLERTNSSLACQALRNICSNKSFH